MGKGNILAPLERIENIEQRLVNNNLLINSNFKNPVNQRGVTTLGDGTLGYWLDRWRLTLPKGKATLNEEYISLTLTKSGLYVELEQLGEFPEQYLGKTVTLSMKARIPVGAKVKLRLLNLMKDNSSEREEVVIEGTGEWEVNKVTMTFNGLDSQHLRLADIVFCEDWSETSGYKEATKDYTLDIEWVKAELGSQATPYVPRLYAEELQLCKRYYQVISYQGSGVVVAGNIAKVVVDFPVEMRVAPTVSIPEVLTEGLFILGTAFMTPTNITAYNYSKNAIFFWIKIDEDGYVGQIASIGKIKIGLDAEL